MEHEGDSITSCNWCTWNKRLIKGLEDLEIRSSRLQHY